MKYCSEPFSPWYSVCFGDGHVVELEQLVDLVAGDLLLVVGHQRVLHGLQVVELDLALGLVHAAHVLRGEVDELGGGEAAAKVLHVGDVGLLVAEDDVLDEALQLHGVVVQVQVLQAPQRLLQAVLAEVVEHLGVLDVQLREDVEGGWAEELGVDLAVVQPRGERLRVAALVPLALLLRRRDGVDVPQRLQALAGHEALDHVRVVGRQLLERLPQDLRQLVHRHDHVGEAELHEVRRLDAGASASGSSTLDQGSRPRRPGTWGGRR